MTIQEKIENASNEALKSGNTQRRLVLSVLVAELKDTAISKRTTALDDKQALAALIDGLKQRAKKIKTLLNPVTKDENGNKVAVIMNAADQARAEEAVEQTRYEMREIEGFLPEGTDARVELPDEVAQALILEAIGAIGATSAKDAGKVLGYCSKSLPPLVDKGEFKAKIDALLS